MLVPLRVLDVKIGANVPAADIDHDLASVDRVSIGVLNVHREVVGWDMMHAPDGLDACPPLNELSLELKVQVEMRHEFERLGHSQGGEGSGAMRASGASGDLWLRDVGGGFDAGHAWAPSERLQLDL